MTDSDGRTVHFVKPVHIVEVHGEDLVAVSSKDKENRTQVFTMEGDRYAFAGLAPFPRLTFEGSGIMAPELGRCDYKLDHSERTGEARERSKVVASASRGLCAI